MTPALHRKAYEENILEAKKDLLKVKDEFFDVANFLKSVLMKKGIKPFPKECSLSKV